MGFLESPEYSATGDYRSPRGCSIDDETVVVTRRKGDAVGDHLRLATHDCPLLLGRFRSACKGSD